ncbi:MAG: response regulator [Acidobacteria bacterium]|nr:response regulator [Acidobacteriota bacterium]
MNGNPPQASILIVDDDVPFASSLQTILGKAGHQIVLAGDCVEAMRLLSSRPFNLVIIDFRVGSLSGLELISSIRDQGIPVRILLLTAFGSEELAKRGKQDGADACLTKPVKRREILECVSQLLSNEGSSHR